MIRKKKPTTSLVRSSAAEYLTFVAASGTGGDGELEEGSVIRRFRMTRLRRERTGKRFFATAPNELCWAVNGQTAGEVIIDRADATKEHMSLRR
jgi:hypothetical protein